jgi:alpha-ribazole phosphatase/probable phosphoglycerate mutase
LVELTFTQLCSAVEMGYRPDAGFPANLPPVSVWYTYAMIACWISPAFLCGTNMRADMKTVYFVRHGSTEGNEQGAYQHAHTPLSELGKRQAAFVAHRFERIPVDIVIASDMERAAETGRCIAERNRFPLVVEPLFHEILHPTILRGKGRDTPEALEIMRFLAEHWTNASVKHSDEENFFDLKTRALRALDYLVARPERTLLVVTHGTFMCMLLGCMMAGEEVSPRLFERIHHFFV